VKREDPSRPRVGRRGVAPAAVASGHHELEHPAASPLEQLIDLICDGLLRGRGKTEPPASIVEPPPMPAPLTGASFTDQQGLEQAVPIA